MLGIELLKRKEVLGFSLYDFSNSSYVLIFNAFLLPIYFKETIFSNHSDGDFYWGLSISISVLIAGLASPVVGFLADKFNRKRIMSLIVIFVCIGMIILSTLFKNNSSIYVLCFIITNTFYVISLALYDSFLPHISSIQERAQISTLAWGFGYIGGVFCFVVVIIIQRILKLPNEVGLLTSAFFYIIFSTLSLILLPGKQSVTVTTPLLQISKNILTRSMVLLLIAIWLINDGIDTIISFASIYGRGTLLIPTETIGALLLIVQIVAFPATLLIGNYSKKLGEKNTIMTTVIVWGIITICLTLANSFYLFVIIMLLTSLVIGSSQALMRSYYSKTFNSTNSGFNFGIYSIITRASALLGPVIFGAISSSTGSQRIAMISVLIPLITGGILFNMFKTSS